MLDVLDAVAVRRWYRRGLEALGEARAEIDALNVYPVPDGDTGTNMYLTMESAVQAAAGRADMETTARQMAHGALLGARGNSGVILSQLLRGIAEVLGSQDDASGWSDPRRGAGPCGPARLRVGREPGRRDHAHCRPRRGGGSLATGGQR